MSAAVTRMPGSGRNRTAACPKTPVGRASGIRAGPTGRPPSSGDSRAASRRQDRHAGYPLRQHQLDFCAIVGCLVGDRDRLYDPGLIDARWLNYR